MGPEKKKKNKMIYAHISLKTRQFQIVLGNVKNVGIFEKFHHVFNRMLISCNRKNVKVYDYFPMSYNKKQNRR